MLNDSIIFDWFIDKYRELARRWASASNSELRKSWRYSVFHSTSKAIQIPASETKPAKLQDSNFAKRFVNDLQNKAQQPWISFRRIICCQEVQN